jgi:hypothetical protein
MSLYGRLPVISCGGLKKTGMQSGIRHSYTERKRCVELPDDGTRKQRCQESWKTPIVLHAITQLHYTYITQLHYTYITQLHYTYITQNNYSLRQCIIAQNVRKTNWMTKVSHSSEFFAVVMLVFLTKIMKQNYYNKVLPIHVFDTEFNENRLPGFKLSWQKESLMFLIILHNTEILKGKGLPSTCHAARV